MRIIGLDIHGAFAEAIAWDTSAPYNAPPSRSSENLKPTNRLPLRLVQKLRVRHASNSLSTQRRQTIDRTPTHGRCDLEPAAL
jgi:hypothetical protein